MGHKQSRLTIETQGQGLYEFTRELVAFCLGSKISVGLVTVFCQHTSASLTIQENADPDVIRDLNDVFRRMVPEDASLYRHTAEGPDDMPAHIRSALTDVSLSIPVSDGRPVLGTWQGIYLFEHRTHRHSRNVVLHISGD
ncbi:MAG: secondary thiamine-phosphate synthase enzyme YjbQ [Rhodospirillales bacterium]|nr:secondary thiamine-phosphate synthase enzyme YjbQ [Rhodospirillales bacterium]